MGARWTDDEERMLRVGRIPAWRTAVAARQRCLKLGKLTGELLGVDMTPRACKKKTYDAATLRYRRAWFLTG